MTDVVRSVALLRGINVGRAKRVGMAQLRALLQALGYTDVSTLLQSGNAIFTSTPGATGSAVADIEAAIVREFGFDVSVVVRTRAELAAAVAANPLLDIASDPSRHLVGFFGGSPDVAGLTALAGMDFGADQVRVIGREVYLWCPAGVLDSPFSKVAWEKLLGVPVTMRNWNTVTKLLELAGG
ncbi:MAG: DUF1697 domain-containing protein [Dehalococcoidia bacterium]